MQGRQKRFYMMAASFALLFFCAIVLMLQISPADVLQNTIELFNRAVRREPQATVTSTPDMQATAGYHETAAFERTAIARFTENPTLALSSTPFFAEIIMNELIRQFTETPVSYRGCRENCPTPITMEDLFRVSPFPTFPTLSAEDMTGISLTITEAVRLWTTTPTSSNTPLFTETPTTTPSPTATIAWKCSPVIEWFYLYELAAQIEMWIQEKGIEISGDVVSDGVGGIDKHCEIPFQPVYTTLRVWLSVKKDSEVSQLSSMADEVYNIVIEKWDKIKNWQDSRYGEGYISPRIFWIYIYDTDGQPLIVTEYHTLAPLYERGLRSEALIEALGGFIQPD